MTHNHLLSLGRFRLPKSRCDGSIEKVPPPTDKRHKDATVACILLPGSSASFAISFSSGSLRPNSTGRTRFLTWDTKNPLWFDWFSYPIPIEWIELQFIAMNQVLPSFMISSIFPVRCIQIQQVFSLQHQSIEIDPNSLIFRVPPFWMRFIGHYLDFLGSVDLRWGFTTLPLFWMLLNVFTAFWLLFYATSELQ